MSDEFTSAVAAFICGLIFFICVLPFVILGINLQPVSGGKTGQILAIEKTGIFWQSEEVSVARGGFSNGNGVVGDITHFTASPSQLPILQRAMNSKEQLTIYYRCPLFYSALHSNSGCFSTLITKDN